MTHRRAQLIDALTEMLETLTAPVEESGFPIQLKTVQKRFAHWTALDKQDALPAAMIAYGDNGSTPDSDLVGYIDEIYPLACTAVFKEDSTGKAITDQVSDFHYAIGQLINANPTLGVEGVLPDRTRLQWRSTEGELIKYEIIKFRIIIVHRYHASENV
ncbi:MAG: hypothetical protein OXL96_13935 [Candidatus Poribacteria bacterium]|nr:hypothetical protein [Candidatus Poribacteria bacterium]